MSLRTLSRAILRSSPYLYYCYTRGPLRRIHLIPILCLHYTIKPHFSFLRAWPIFKLKSALYSQSLLLYLIFHLCCPNATEKKAKKKRSDSRRHSNFGAYSWHRSKLRKNTGDAWAYQINLGTYRCSMTIVDAKRERPVEMGNVLVRTSWKGITVQSK